MNPKESTEPMSIDYTPGPLLDAARNTPTALWNDSADPDELRQSISFGGVGATCNPVIAYTTIKKHLDVWAPRIQAIADAVASRDNLVIDEMKSALMEAAVTLAEALLGVELSEAETGAKAALKRALSMNDPKEIVSVHLNPQDVVTLHNLGVESPVELVPDKELDPGDAVAYMPEGLLDARLSSAIRRAREALERAKDAEE